MASPFGSAALAACFLAGWPSLAPAQTFDTVGTRAAGMGGAFVAVADDASAAYWNPGGFAAGNYFTMVLDRRASRVGSRESDGGARRSGLLVALGMPALGLSYYRLHSAALAPATISASGPAADVTPRDPDQLRLDMLVTHHSGITLVQSIARGVAIGTTVKLVRGIAASVLAPGGDRDELLGSAGHLDGRGTTKFDADVGIMAASGAMKAGLTIRNLTEPNFRTQSQDRALSLRRQARAGIALAVAPGWAVAADLDLNRSGAFEPVRDFAAGTEARIGRKAFLRSGFHVNTAGPRRPAVSAGASYAAMGSVLIDAQFTGGSDPADRGWGIAARFVY
jgi:hypothetical protein